MGRAERSIPPYRSTWCLAIFITFLKAVHLSQYSRPGPRCGSEAMADHRGRGHTHVIFPERIPMNDLELIPRPKHVSLTIFAQAEHLAVGCPGRGSEGAARQSLRRQMSEVGLAYLGCLAAATTGRPGLGTVGLLMLSGPITTVPLLFFGAAARRLRLSTLGILQLLSPTLQFLLAVRGFRGTLRQPNC